MEIAQRSITLQKGQIDDMSRGNTIYEVYLNRIHAKYFNQLFSFEKTQLLFKSFESLENYDGLSMRFLDSIVHELVELYNRHHDQVEDTCALFMTISNPDYYLSNEDSLKTSLALFLTQLLECYYMRFN